MKLADLQVLNLDGTAVQLTPAALAAASGHGQAWVIATCQRTVLVAAGREARAALAERLPQAVLAQGYAGADAYAFLLRFACGLESRLVGEAEFFRQIKESWREFCGHPGLPSGQLDFFVLLPFPCPK